MRKFMAVSVLAVICFVPAAAQVRSQGKMSDVIVTSNRPVQEIGRAVKEIRRTFVEERRAVTSDRWTADTVYYTGVERRFDWFTGLGRRVTRAQAMAAPQCFRFTMKNPLGHYLRVESLSYGRPAPSLELASYLYFPYKKYIAVADQTKVSAWLSDESSIASVTVIPSGDGKRVQAEHAVAADGHAIYDVFIERIADRRSVGVIIDASGRILSLIDNDCYAENTLMLVDYDTDGRVKDAIWLDGEGWPVIPARYTVY